MIKVMGRLIKKLENKIYSVENAAKLLGIKKAGLYHLIRSGELKALQITDGGRYRIRPEELSRFMKKDQTDRSSQ